MGTLGTQLAYVFHLGTEAATPRIRNWTPDYLTSDAIAWSQHIDLIWPTLSETDKRLVSTHATQLTPNPLSSSVPRSWLKFILTRVICNRHTPHPVRVAALHHYSESLRSAELLEEGESPSVVINVGTLIDAQLRPMRKRQALLDLTAIFTHKLKEATSERLRLETDYYLTQSRQKEGVAVGLALTDYYAQQGSEKISGLVAAICIQKSPDLLNGLLFAANTSGICHGELRRVTVNELSSRILLHPLDIKLIVQLDPWPLARLSELEESFGQAYMSQLTHLNKQCQMAMLADFLFAQDTTGDEAASEDTVSKVFEMWQCLFVQPSCVILVREALSRDFARFRAMLPKNRPEPSAVYDVVVGVWMAFYKQFLE
ncbi:hypothetical protein IWW38_001386 [Coemansia aciculifera]|uniref:Uncharacterized protein n=1 Tax=Coemansia aciculifera TaxID=417176 RepID=A0ACC1M875_9FUNG|nr:hypothetical protein IWW38_001386 [Coemansia aciculifera]